MCVCMCVWVMNIYIYIDLCHTAVHPAICRSQINTTPSWGAKTIQLHFPEPPGSTKAAVIPDVSQCTISW